MTHQPGVYVPLTALFLVANVITKAEISSSFSLFSTNSWRHYSEDTQLMFLLFTEN